MFRVTTLTEYETRVSIPCRDEREANYWFNKLQTKERVIITLWDEGKVIKQATKIANRWQIEEVK